MKQLLIIFFFLFFTIPSFSQWWTDGGNLIWPYGSVKITKGDMSLSSGSLRLGSHSKITADSLSWSDPVNQSKFYVLSNGTDYSEFYLKLSDFGQADGSTSIYASSEDGIEIQSPYLSLTSSKYPLEIHKDLVVDSTITSNVVIDKSALHFAAVFSLDNPNTYFEMDVYRNDIGALVDTFLFDNTLQRFILAFDGNENIDFDDYKIMPSRAPAFIYTSAGAKAVYLVFSKIFYTALNREALQCLIYDANTFVSITDFTSGVVSLNLIFIPSSTSALGYQHKEHGL